MKNICIVGYGAIGPIHAAAVNKTASARVYAICDINADRLKAGAEKHGAVAYMDFKDALEDKNIHAVHICTPHYLHLEMMRAALEAGKEVICEKPLTMTEDELDQLLSIEGSDKVCVVFQNRLNPCIEELKRIAESGELGRLLTAKAVVTWHRDESYYANDSWRGKYATEGGGVLINQSIHTLDHLVNIVGNISSVKALTANFAIDSIEVEDTCVAHLSFARGISGIFFATNAYGDNPTPEVEVFFEKGRVKYTGGKLFVGGQKICEDDRPDIGKMYWGKGHELIMKAYYDEGKRFSPRDVENTMRSVFAIYKSAKAQGAEIAL